MSCQVQQPERGEAAAAPCPQVQLVVRLKCIPSRHGYAPHVYAYSQHRDNTDGHAEHSHGHRQLWLSRMEVCEWEYVYTYVQGGSFQQLGLGTQSAQ